MQNTANVSDLRVRIQDVLDRIERACARSGRSARDVSLIAVTKTVPTAAISAALAAGVRHIGENRVQEARDKFPALDAPYVGHLIGRLQTNKVRYVPHLFEWVHSVDRIPLAEALGRRFEAESRTVNCLLQVNVTGEESKQGVALAELRSLAEAVGRVQGIRVKGLMTMAAYGASESELRRTFASLRAAARSLSAEGLPNVDMEHLSMGMSGDFEIAVEEGATMVRVGSAIFGPRF